MAQAITDVKTFLEDARQAVVELAEFEKQEETLAQEEKKRLRVLETERKAVADAVNSTVKRRRDEIEKSYDDELGKLQDKLKRTRTRREKAKNQGIKGGLRKKRRSFTRTTESFPCGCGRCSSRIVFHLSAKAHCTMRCISEGIQRISDGVDYLCDLFPVDPVRHLQAASRTEDFIPGDDLRRGCGCFGGLYILIGNWTKDRHLAALQEGRSIRSLIAANNRKIAVITSSIRRDRSEALYDLEKYDDEISQMEQDLETAKKKRTH